MRIYDKTSGMYAIDLFILRDFPPNRIPRYEELRPGEALY